VEYPEELNAKPDLHGNLPVSMVNLIAQQRLIPELLQGDFTAANVASALTPLLIDGPERERQVRGLSEVRRQLVPGGEAETTTNAPPIARVADAVVRLLSTVPDA
jgi:lipid-A-disaccharide synthase